MIVKTRNLESLISADFPADANLFENIVNSNIDGILAFDKEFRYTLWNPAMERISGKKASEVLGKVAFEVFPFLIQTREDRFFRRALEGEVIVANDGRFNVPETGHVGYFVGIYAPVKDRSGNIIGGLSIVRDVTDRKESELALLESELKYRSLTEFARDAIFSARSDGTILTWNRGAKNIFDFEKEEIVGKNLAAIIPHSFWWGFVTEVLKSKNQEQLMFEGRKVELYGTRKYGSNFPMEVGLTAWMTDGELFLSLVVRDISDRKHLEAQAEEKSELYQAILRAQSELGQGIAIINPDGPKLQYVNQALADILGYSIEELVSMKTLFDFVPADQLDMFKKRLESKDALTNLVDVRRYDTVLVTKQGRRVTVSVVSKMMESSFGLVSVAIIRDMSSEKKIEEALRQAEGRFGNVFQTSKVIMGMLELDGEIISLNPFFSKKLNWSIYDWQGKSFYDLVHPDSLEKARAVFESVARGNPPETFDFKLKSESGEYREFEVSPSPLFSKSQISGIFLIIRDVNAKKKEAAQILEERMRYQFLADASSEGVCLIEKDRIVEANLAFAKLFGYETHETLGLKPSELVAKEFSAKVTQTINSGVHTRYQIMAKRKDGTLFGCEVSGKTQSYQGREIRLSVLRALTEEELQKSPFNF